MKLKIISIKRKIKYLKLLFVEFVEEFVSCNLFTARCKPMTS